MNLSYKPIYVGLFREGSTRSYTKIKYALSAQFHIKIVKKRGEICSKLILKTPE